MNVSGQHIVQKGSFDVTIVNTGDGIPIVWLLFRRAGQIKDNIGLDWRDISEPEVASATELLDLILGWNIAPTIISPADAATIAKVDSSATNIMLLAANTSRRKVIIFNNSTAYLYIKFGTDASTDSFTVKISAGNYFELPSPSYTGRIDGIWSDVNGNAMITEIT
jgi:hypothetical protein